MTMSQHSTTFSLASQAQSTRTVFDILWSCLFTIFACTWTVQHLNVPTQREDLDLKAGWKGDFRYGLMKFWTGVKWMVITILAPELLITLNAGQLIGALRSSDRLKEYAEQDGVPWSLTHSLFADMGGFVIREYAPERVDTLPALLGSRCGRGKPELAETEARVADFEDGDAIQVIETGPAGITTASLPKNLEAQPPKKPKSMTLVADEIWGLRRSGIIKLPYITRDEIMDKGKSDSFSRVVAIAQTFWVGVQVIVRASRHLEISQLEVGTTSFVSSALLIYGLNWHKPKSVGVPLTLWSFSGPVPDEIVEGLSILWRQHCSYIPNSPWHGQRMHLINDDKSYWLGERLVTDTKPKGFLLLTRPGGAEIFGFLMTSITFGAVHFAAIKSTFPSHVEKIMWCAASSVCTGITLFLVFRLGLLGLSICCWNILAWLLKFLGGRNGSRWAPCIHPTRRDRAAFDAVMDKLSLYLVIVIYSLARIFLVVELFRCLFFLPPSAFVGTWVSKVPHVS